MLKYRLISIAFLIPIIIVILFLLPKILFSIFIIIICMIAAWEWGQISGFKSKYERIYLAVICGVLLAIMLFLLPKYYIHIHQLLIIGSLYISLIWWIIALFLVLFYPNSATFWRNSKILRLIFGLLIIVPFFYGTLALRTWRYDENHYIGGLLLFHIIVLVWSADSGAYIFGKLFGKHKLLPKLSPSKTWQGFIGGLATAIIISFSYSLLTDLEITPFMLFICSIMSVLGDLTESMFKREAGIKDSSHLIPGHGGMLDRIDSLTAAIPIFACFITISF